MNLLKKTFRIWRQTFATFLKSALNNLSNPRISMKFRQKSTDFTATCEKNSVFSEFYAHFLKNKKRGEQVQNMRNLAECWKLHENNCVEIEQCCNLSSQSLNFVLIQPRTSCLHLKSWRAQRFDAILMKWRWIKLVPTHDFLHQTDKEHGQATSGISFNIRWNFDWHTDTPSCSG